MDPQRFDELAKIMAASSSRRRFLARAIAAGAAALGLTARVARPGAAAPKDDKLLQTCQNHLARCAERPERGQCVDCAARFEAKCAGVLGPDLETTTCPCTSHADCDDGNACTVDLCGPVSHQCFNIAIADDCVQCKKDSDCAGGSCCHGRCCPAGAGCQLSATGEPVCCPDCGGGVSCCDKISYSCGAELCGYEIGAARCSYGEGACASCPPLCTTSIAGYREVGAGGICGVENVCLPIGTSPVGAIA